MTIYRSKLYAEFEPTRDPKPWVIRRPEVTSDGYGPGGYPMVEFRSDRPQVGMSWAPRREQFDTPVNPILEWFRQLWAGQVDIFEQAEVMADNLGNPDYLWEMEEDGYTPEQIDHARRVLTRLAWIPAVTE